MKFHKVGKFQGREEMDSSDNSSSVNLSGLSPNAGSRRKRKRLGIGEGSGNGKTCGKGQNGQKSRSGCSIPVGFEGGQMPIHRRLPKVGFTSRKKLAGTNVYSLVSLDRLASSGLEGEVKLDDLVSKGLVNNSRQKVKLLGGGKLTGSFKIEVHAASAAAKAAVEKAGGEVILIGKGA